MQIKSDERVLIIGKTGSGKTYFAKKKLWGGFVRRIFHDVKLENNDLLSGATLATDPKMLADCLLMARPSILYQPRNLTVEDFDEVCKAIYLKGNYTLFVDEASAYSEPSQISPWHKEIMVRGRSRGIGIVNLTQRPRRIHSDIISEAEHLFVFRLNLETDVEKIRFMLPKEWRERIYTLPLWQCIYCHDGKAILIRGA